MTKTALITGGGGAIALAIAQQLAKRGYAFVLADIDATRMAANAAAVPNVIETIIADLSVQDGLDVLARRLESGTPAIDLLVNTAGIIRPGTILELPFSEIDRHLKINLVAPAFLAQAAGKAMAARGGGTILSIVSAAALVALPGSAAYSASKFGLRGFLTAARMELAPHKVKVCSVFPGAVDTPMLRYEATHNGSALNFLNGDVLTADQVAAACMKAIDSGKAETFVPFSDALLSKLISIAPGLLEWLAPKLEKTGERGRAKFIASRGLTIAKE
ncbi:MAG TPA: SDR family NAD(P)-dependent oxidoreductase [Rhizomicrobium sp.]|jgi:short-subunit dehydrogenase|nr:SDR family NAD(P)-dependent oxidoreductase [Rhizomicrobium sp.]